MKINTLVHIAHYDEIGANATIRLGAIVVKNVDVGLTVVGNPAKPLVK